MKHASLLLCLIGAVSVYAQMPKTLNYQGTLAMGSAAVPDGDYSVTFRLYTGSSGGSAVWTEAQLVSARNGVFNAILGKIVPLPASFNTSYWMSLQVGTDPELSPRLEMTAISYSLQSAVSDSTRKVGDGSIGTTQLANGSVTGAKIVNGSITGTQVASATLTSANILDEPGVSSSQANGHWLDAGNIMYVLDSVDITLPTSGYVVVIASGYAFLRTNTTVNTNVLIGISANTTTIPSNGENFLSMPANARADWYQIPFSTTNFFSTGAGAHRYYLLGQYAAGTDPMTFLSPTRLTAMYFPKLMGTLSKSAAEIEPYDIRRSPDGSAPVKR